MARCQLAVDKSVVGVENESPRHGRRTAYNLRIHKIAQAYAAGCERCSNGNVVEQLEHWHFVLPDVEHKREEESDGSAVARQSAVADKLKSAFGKEAYWQNHFDKALKTSEICVWFVEDAMAETRTYKYAEEAIEEERFELLFVNLLLLVKTVNDGVCKEESDAPKKAVPAQCKTAYAERF